MANDSRVEERVRARLRHLRFERGLRLADVAAAAGMATSTLSRLESGARGLTLDHVARLAVALGVDPDAVLARRSTGADDVAPPQARDGKTWWPLADERTAGPRAYRVTIPAELCEPVLHTHEGHQWVYVLRGRLRVVVDGRDGVVGPGEALRFSTWLPHWIGAVDGPVELLTIFDPDGRGAPTSPRAV